MPFVEHPRWLRTLLLPLAAFYTRFMCTRAALYRRGTLRPRRLPGKVISIGNLSIGGTGKTPLVLWLARRLQQRGIKVAVLSRGYGRVERKPRVLHSRRPVGVEEVGDEPLMLARHLADVPVGVGADRFRVGELVAGKFHPEVFLLDDGFQHLRLARDVDIVLLDSSDPFGGGYALPAGRLRESPAALARADMVVLTRLRTSFCNASKLVENVRLYNPQVSIFGARTRLEGLYDATTHKQVSLDISRQQPVFAFCGIGNDAAFWQDVREWGFKLAGRASFRDHHRYTVEDFEHIIRQADRVGARALLTTEKDVVNFTVLPPSVPACFYCRIELEVDDEEGFWSTLLGRLKLSLVSVPRSVASNVD